MARFFILIFIAAQLFGAGPDVFNIMFDQVSKSQARLTFNTSRVANPKTATLGADFMSSGPFNGPITLSGSSAAKWPDHGVAQVGNERFIFFSQGRTGDCGGGGDQTDRVCVGGRYINEATINPMSTAAGIVRDIVVANNVATVTTTVPHRKHADQYISVSGGPFNNTVVIISAAPSDTTYTFPTSNIPNGTYNNGIVIQNTVYGHWAQDHPSGTTVTLDSNSFIFCYAEKGKSFNESQRITQLWSPQRAFSRFHLAYIGGLKPNTEYSYKIRAFQDGAEFYNSYANPKMDVIGCTASANASITDQLGTFTTQGLSDPRAKLPVEVVDTAMPASFGRTYTVAGDCHDLQSVIDRDAQVNDPANSVIRIPKSAVCIAPAGGYRLRNKLGTGTTVIRTDADDTSLPGEGTRINPTYVNVLPKIVAAGFGDNTNVIGGDAKAHNYRLFGLNIGTDPNADATTMQPWIQLVSLYVGDDPVSPTKIGGDSSRQASHILFDRCYIGGQEKNTLQVQSALRLNGKHVGVINSYIHNINSHQENGAITAEEGSGPFLIENNHVEGGSNTVFFTDNGHYDDAIPDNITIRRNHIFKPLNYFYKDPSFNEQTKLAITGAEFTGTALKLMTEQSHDIGSQLAPESVTISGGTGQLAELNGTYSGLGRVDRNHFTVPFSVSDTVEPGSTTQFTASVLGTSDAGVRWSLAGPGSISNTGSYTAPNNAQGTEFAVITATSTADATRSSSRLITLQPSNALVLTPKRPPQLNAGMSVKFSVNRNVTWSLSPQVGSIASDGTYTAPGTLNGQQAVMVIATDASAADQKAAALVILEPRQAIVRVNAGANTAFTDASGQVWTEDRNFTGGSTGSTATTQNGTPFPYIYQTERYNHPNPMVYTFPVNNGMYAVKLHFNEFFLDSAQQRVFDVFINGQKVESNLDVFAKVGKNAAYSKTYAVNVSDGSIIITFNNNINAAKIAGIEIFPDSEPVRVFTSSPASSSISLDGQKLVVSYGRSHNAKNLLELKTGSRVLIEGNILENNWAFGRGTSSAQSGTVFLATPRGRDASYTGGWPLELSDARSFGMANNHVGDVTYRNNIVRNAVGGWAVSGLDNLGMVSPTRRITIENNLLYDMDGTKWTEGGAAASSAFFVTNGVEDFTFNHNTVLATIGNGQVFSGEGEVPNSGLYVENNILPFGSGPNGVGGLRTRMVCANPPDCSESWFPFWNGGGNAEGKPYLWSGNIMIADPNNYGQSNDAEGWENKRAYFKRPYQPDDTDFTNTRWIGKSQGGIASLGALDRGKGRFTVSSANARSATDSRSPGVENSELENVTAGVIEGVPQRDKRVAVLIQPSSTGVTFQYTAPVKMADCSAVLSPSAEFDVTAGSVSHSRLPVVSLRTQRDQVTGLLPATRYYYKVACPAGMAIGSFQTASLQ